jgi:hypothetical protein
MEMGFLASEYGNRRRGILARLCFRAAGFFLFRLSSIGMGIIVMVVSLFNLSAISMRIETSDRLLSRCCDRRIVTP